MMYFAGYGKLRWLSEEEWGTGDWVYYEEVLGEDGELYDIMWSGDCGEMRYMLA